MARTNWKRRAEELEAEVRRVRAYAFDYGNAVGECDAGYLQHPNYICHKCNADDYRKGCPLAKKAQSSDTRGKAHSNLAEADVAEERRTQEREAYIK